MPDQIKKTVTVPLDPDRAFDLFTREMADWWPLDSHSLSAGTGRPARTVTVEPRVGGTVTETKADGTTAPWGRVTEWQPGAVFGMTWHVGRSEDRASRVRVCFDAVMEGTRVTLVHDNWQALGHEAGASRANYDTGWNMVLGERFVRAARRVAVPV